MLFSQRCEVCVWARLIFRVILPIASQSQTLVNPPELKCSEHETRRLLINAAWTPSCDVLLLNMLGFVVCSLPSTEASHHTSQAAPVCCFKTPRVQFIYMMYERDSHHTFYQHHLRTVSLYLWGIVFSGKYYSLSQGPIRYFFYPLKDHLCSAQTQ